MCYTIDTPKGKELIQMQKFIITKHCTEERMERLVNIGMTIGFGEEVLIERYNRETDHVERLMDNGLLLILGSRAEILITAFPVDIDRAFAMYAEANKELPRTVIKYFVSKAYKKMRQKIESSY
jgi:hypothetical protein